MSKAKIAKAGKDGEEKKDDWFSVQLEVGKLALPPADLCVGTPGCCGGGQGAITRAPPLLSPRRGGDWAVSSRPQRAARRLCHPRAGGV